MQTYSVLGAAWRQATGGYATRGWWRCGRRVPRGGTVWPRRRCPRPAHRGRKREGRGGGRRRDSGHAGHAARARTLPRTSASNRSGMRESRQSKWSFQSAACAAIAHSFTAGPPQRPLHTCTRSTLTPTSHALCDIRAILVGIVRKSCRRGQHATFCARLRQTAPAPYRIFFLRHVWWDIPSVWGLRVGADDRRRPGMAGAHARRARALVDHPSAPEASST